MSTSSVVEKAGDLVEKQTLPGSVLNGNDINGGSSNDPEPKRR
jgi:hypothetical protein